MWRVLFIYKPQRLIRLCTGLLLLVATIGHAKPQRIIALAPHLTEQVYSLGAGERLVATVDYADYPEAAKQLPRIGNYQYISIESIITLKPDLVLVWQQGNQRHLAEQLRALGIKVYVSKGQRLDELAEQFAKLGQALGEDQRGQALSQKVKQKLHQLRQRYQQQAKVSVFYQMWHQPLRSISAKSWLNDGIELCGGENIMAEAPAPYPVLSEEWVLAADPQAIVVVQWEFTHPWQNWPQLKAVKHHTIYSLDPDKAHRFTLRYLESLTALCQALDDTRKKTHSEN